MTRPLFLWTGLLTRAESDLNKRIPRGPLRPRGIFHVMGLSELVLRCCIILRMKWTPLKGNVACLRAKVPGGWLVMVGYGQGAGLTFYPDPQHLWDGTTLP